ncbi:hypothetical protein SAMN05216344_10961 [Polaromonas sp. OV174]|nr:hypothetical protein SAMN05216344_10961 [Polaromonas sp. OV174]
MRKEKYRIQRSKVSPVSEIQLKWMRDPEGETARLYPTVYEVLMALHEAGIRISEFRRIDYGHQIGIAGGAILDIFTKSGTIVVKGDVYKNGATGKPLKKALPKHSVWMR